jgi:hypothetical protein
LLSSSSVYSTSLPSLSLLSSTSSNGHSLNTTSRYPATFAHGFYCISSCCSCFNWPKPYKFFAKSLEVNSTSNEAIWLPLRLRNYSSLKWSQIYFSELPASSLSSRQSLINLSMFGKCSSDLILQLLNSSETKKKDFLVRWNIYWAAGTCWRGSESQEWSCQCPYPETKIRWFHLARWIKQPFRS